MIVDAYNANPTSMSAAVKSFFSLPAARRALILGDMRELGTQSAAAHQELVLLVQSLQEAAPETAPDAAQTRLFWVGPCFTQAVAQCGAPGVCVPHKEALLDLLRKQPLRGYTILLKGSNGIGLSHIAHSGAI